MERTDVLELMSTLKLYGMRAAYDEVMTTGIKRRHEPPRIVGDLLSAEIAEKQARSIKYQLTIAKLPLAKDIDNFDFSGTPINEVLVRDLASGEKRRLTRSRDFRQFAYFSTISPDNCLIAYAWFNADKFYELRVMALDGSAPRTLFHNEEAGFVQPCAWSPDSKQILTLFFRKDNSSQIALLSASDGAVRVLKSLNWVNPRKMDVSPDGRYIVYDEAGSEEAPTSNLYVLASDGEAVSVSPYTGEALGRIEFSDGSFIAPVLADNTLYILTQDADLIAYR